MVPGRSMAGQCTAEVDGQRACPMDAQSIDLGRAVWEVYSGHRAGKLRLDPCRPVNRPGDPGAGHDRARQRSSGSAGASGQQSSLGAAGAAAGWPA